MPFFLKGGGIHRPGDEGRSWRQCTQEYKLKPIRREVRRMLAESGEEKAIMWLGISWAELERAKMPQVKYVENRFPLLEKQMNRLDCIAWLAAKAYPI